MTLLYTDPFFLKHDTGPHVEVADRLRAITARLEESGLVEQCKSATYQLLDEETLREVHSDQMIQTAKRLAASGGGHLDPDTVVSPDSFEVARAASGACVAAVEAVLTGEDHTALCLVRPPGHHATPTRSMGFCLFNHIALAANHALRRHGLDHVLIVDWDVHHGNGTQDCFYPEPRVMYFSIHRYGMGFYPGTGSPSEAGEGAGVGFTLNVPVRSGISRDEYHEQFLQGLERAAEKIKPQLVLISAGFDAHVDDPIGSLCLESDDFARLTREVLTVAKAHADGRVVSSLEGGYNVEALAESVEAHLRELLG